MLKRGLPRQSCDFCHRRKIKCDRLSRVRQGLDSCSQCALREGPCYLNDPSDKRTPKRHRKSPVGSMDLDEPPTAGGRVSRDDNPAPLLAPTPQLEYLQSQRHAVSRSFHYMDNMFSEHFLDLSRDNIFFLDQFFMDEGEAPVRWLDRERTPLQGNRVSNIGASETGIDGNGSENQGGVSQVPLVGEEVDITFTAALHAYFKFAAPWLPILLEDAFWEDYHNGRCSQILLFAIACRGIPFTTFADKWDTQQRFANDFREAFLTARSTASDDGTIRLDDLEALALMVNFDYDNANSPALHLNLGALFLKHESLVLMTLQSRIEDRISTADDRSIVSLARARERRTLLYWHVYGLDAFHCLDRKQLSLIPDKEVLDRDQFPQHEAKDFFGAVFELALIARQLLQRLCSNSAKRHGIEPGDVHRSYAQIHQWSTHTCPSHLRRREGCSGFSMPDTEENYDDSLSEISPHGQKKYTQLHRSVIWALEINCKMQIESFVSEFGLKHAADLHTESTMSRVEYESLRAVNEMSSICRWIDQHPIRDEEGKEHSLVDLAPLALRNVCAGLCFWSSTHGIKSIQTSNIKAPTAHAPREREKRAISAYIETATFLRNTAAKAISHRDTVEILERLDKQVALLKSAAEDAL